MRLLGRFVSIQVVIQGLGFASGILIVRSLSKQDYAWYTVANMLASTMTLLADSGISAALSSLGGTVWQDDARRSLDQYAELSPLMDREVKKWLAARRADVAYLLNEPTVAAEQAKQVGENKR